MESKDFFSKDIEDFFVKFLWDRMGISPVRIRVEEDQGALMALDRVQISIHFPSFFVVSADLFSRFEWIEFWYFRYIKQSDELKLDLFCNKKSFVGVWK